MRETRPEYSQRRNGPGLMCWGTPQITPTIITNRAARACPGATRTNQFPPRNWPVCNCTVIAENSVNRRKRPYRVRESHVPCSIAVVVTPIHGQHASLSPLARSPHPRESGLQLFLFFRGRALEDVEVKHTAERTSIVSCRAKSHQLRWTSKGMTGVRSLAWPTAQGTQRIGTQPPRW